MNSAWTLPDNGSHAHSDDAGRAGRSRTVEIKETVGNAGMERRTLILSGLVSSGLISGLAVAGQNTAAKAPVVIAEAFRKDDTFKKAVSVVVTDEALSSVLPSIGKQLGIELRTSRDTGDDKISLAVKNRPAGEILSLISNSLDFIWLKEGAAYRLDQSLVARKREAALARGEQDRRLAEIADRMKRIGALAGLPQDQLASRRDEAMRLAQDPNTSAAQRAQAVDESEAIRDLLRPGARPALAIWGRLSGQQRDSLAAGGSIRFSSEDGSLPRGVSDQIAAAGQSQRGMSSVAVSQEIRIGPGGGPPPALGVGPDDQDNGPKSYSAEVKLVQGGARGVIRIGGLGSPAPEPRPRLEFTLLTISGGMGRRRTMPIMWSPTISSSAADESWPDTQTRDPRLLAEIDLKLPPTPAGGQQLFDPFAPGRIPGARSVGTLAALIHAETGLQLLADSFIRARMNPAPLAGKQQVVKLLDQIARQMRYSWRMEGDTIVFRNPKYFRDRPAEVPDRVLKPLKQNITRSGAPRLNDLADTAAALTDGQTLGLQSNWGAYMEGVGPATMGPTGIHDLRHHLRFWASLNTMQRQTALGGSIVGVGQMTAPQRERWLVALTAPSEGRIFEPSSNRPTPNPQQLAGGGFSMRQGQGQMFSMSGPPGGIGGPGSGAPGAPGAPGEVRQNVGVFILGDVSVGGRPGGGPGLPPGGGALAQPRILGPNGQQLDLAGARRVTLDNFSFNYHLAGQEQPVRSVSLSLPQPEPRKP